MNLRHFFTSQVWWGKLIGAFFGYLSAGSVGAIIGILIGNIFDRGVYEHFSAPHWSYQNERRTALKESFLHAVFATMGYIAKADGRVSEKEIRFVQKIMHDLRLNHIQQARAREYFTQGKTSGFEYQPLLQPFLDMAQVNPNLIRLLIDLVFKMAQVDGLSRKKIESMNAILTTLRFAPLHEQHHFYQHANTGYSQQQSHSSRQHYTSGTRSTANIDTAYTLLGVHPNNTKQEIQRAYRRLLSRHHPDKLIAKGQSKEAIKKATEKTQAIRKAYEEICSSKGW